MKVVPLTYMPMIHLHKMLISKSKINVYTKILKFFKNYVILISYVIYLQVQKERKLWFLISIGLNKMLTFNYYDF